MEKITYIIAKDIEFVTLMDENPFELDSSDKDYCRATMVKFDHLANNYFVDILDQQEDCVQVKVFMPDERELFGWVYTEILSVAVENPEFDGRHNYSETVPENGRKILVGDLVKVGDYIRTSGGDSVDKVVFVCDYDESGCGAILVENDRGWPAVNGTVSWGDALSSSTKSFLINSDKTRLFWVPRAEVVAINPDSLFDYSLDRDYPEDDCYY